jgi:hypothetical protein
LRDRGNSRAGALEQRIAVQRIADRRRKHIGHAHRAVVAQQHHPGFECAGDAGREQSGAGHQIEAFALVVLDRRARRRHALAADHFRLGALDVVDDDRHVAAGPVQVRLDDLQRERGRDGCVECIAAPFQYAHAHRRCDPMGRGHDAERAFDLGAGGESAGIDIGHIFSLRHRSARGMAGLLAGCVMLRPAHRDRM